MSHTKLINHIFAETKFASRHLVERDFGGLIDQTLQEAQPISDEFWKRLDYVDDFKRLIPTNPTRALELIENESPVLLNKDLASIALLRKGHFTEARSHRVAGMVSFEEDFPEKHLEAAFAISHWKNWHQKPSTWLHWDSFFELIDLGLKDDRYEIWSAYSFIWALHQNGGDISLSDSDYSELIWHFKEVLTAGLNDPDRDLQIACNIALGKLHDWKQTATFGDVLSELTQR